MRQKFRTLRMKRKKPGAPLEADEKLSPEQIRELRRRIADADNPVRYVVFSDITGDGRWRLWLDVSGDGYGMSIDQATLFKRERVARAVARVYSKGRRNRLLIAKITTKKDKRRVLKYEKPERLTSESPVIARRPGADEAIPHFARR